MARKRPRAARDLSPSELHSRAELQCLGALLNVLRRGALTQDGIREAVRRGNGALFTDACFDDPRRPGAIAFEYDEEHWHRLRVDKDVDKSAEQLAHPGVTCLLRVRRGGRDWAGRSIAARVNHAAYCEALVESTRPLDQARAACEALGVACDAAAALRGAELGTAVHAAFDEDRKSNLARIEQACGQRDALRVARVSGVHMRLWDAPWVECLLQFGELLGGAEYLRTALSGSVAARLDDGGFREDAARLVAALGREDAARLLGRNCATVRLARVVAAAEAAPRCERHALFQRLYSAASRGAAALEAQLPATE